MATAKVRTFEELSQVEQQEAEEKALTNILRDILELGLRFNDEANSDDLQARIDGAINQAERMQTPWFAHEYILDVAGDDLRAMARSDAEDALYPHPSVYIIHLAA